MANFCLTKQATQNFLNGLKSREIDPQKLSKMTSEARHDFLAKYVGKENAKEVNALLESKLLLKNQQQGMITWAKKVSGIKKETRRDMISRIERMDKFLNPHEEELFMKDLASTRLGVDVTKEEAKNIAELSSKISDAKANIEKGGDRMVYGRAKVALGNYINQLKEEAGKPGIVTRLKNAPVKVVLEAPGTAKAIKASLDNSALFRQGWKTLWTHPDIWMRNARKSFSDIVRTIGKKPVMDEVMADIISRPNYDRMVKAKLATATIEEAFPTDLPSKIPLFGRFYKASENAYTAFLHRTRADIFDKYLEIAEKSGINIDDPKELKPIGSLVNSLTGRGNLAGLEPAANAINNVFFSPRLLKSEIDTLGHVFTGAGGSKFVRKQAAINLVKVIAGTAAVLTIAKAINPNSVETDPRSSDFGKIKVGNTRFDVTGGMASVATLAMRLITMSTKSSTTGKVTQLNSGEFGEPTGVDVVVNFFENKLSPAASIVKDLLKGKDFNGDKITIGGELNNLFTPLPITTYQELKKDPNSAPILLAMIADGLGFSVNTYGATKSDWNDNPGKELIQFKAKVGDQNYQAANEKFNKRYEQWLSETSKKSSYQQLSDDAKASLITKAKNAIKDQIFKDYNFRYRRAVLPSSKKKEQEMIKSLIPSK